MYYFWLTLLLLIAVIGIYCALQQNPLNAEAPIKHRLKTLRQLMWLFQTHRGKSIAYLSGDTKVLKEIEVIARQIENAIKDYGDAEQSSPYWSSTLTLWQRIVKQWHKSTIEENFKQHNALIKQLMYCLEDELTSALIMNNKAAIYSHAYSGGKLLNVIEYLGQTRAIGTNVTSSGKCESVTKIRLSYLSQKLNESVCNLESQDIKFKHHSGLIPPILQCVQERLLPAQNLMSTQEWFSLCTGSIDTLYQHFDETILGNTR